MDKRLDELKAVRDEWEGDVHDLDSKLASGKIPEHDNLDAKMKVELWFALSDAIQQIIDLHGELIQEGMRAAGAARHIIGNAFDFLMPKAEKDQTIKDGINQLKALLEEQPEKET